MVVCNLILIGDSHFPPPCGLLTISKSRIPKAEPLAHGVKRGVRAPLSEGSGRGAPTLFLGLTSPKPRWQEVVDPPAGPPQKGVALLKPTKGEAMLGSK